MADSRYPGWISPAPGPEEARLEDALHDMVCGITQLPGSLVRPRWQAAPPKAPAPEVNWCAIGIVNGGSPGGVEWHAHGRSTVDMDERLTVMATFYGPNSAQLAARLRAGLWLEQNRATLRMSANLALVSAGDITAAPELVDLRWLRRHDILLTFARGPWPGSDEGQADIRDLADARACGLCGRSR